MKDKRWGDKITSQSITRDYDDVISRNQIRGSKMAVLKLALLGEQESLLALQIFLRIKSRSFSNFRTRPSATSSSQRYTFTKCNA